MKNYFKTIISLALITTLATQPQQSPKKPYPKQAAKTAPRQKAKPVQATKPVTKKTDQELLREQVAHFNKTNNKDVIEYFKKDKRLKDFCLKNLIPIRNWTEKDKEDTKKWARSACQMIIDNNAPGELYDNFYDVQWAIGRILDNAFDYFTGTGKGMGPKGSYATQAADCVPNENDFFNKNEIMKAPRKANFVSRKSEKELLQQQIARISKHKWLDKNKALKDFCYQNLCPIGNWTKQDQLNTEKWIRKVDLLMRHTQFDPRGENTNEVYLGMLIRDAFVDSPYYLSLTNQAKWISDAYEYGRYLALPANYENNFNHIANFLDLKNYQF